MIPDQSPSSSFPLKGMHQQLSKSNALFFFKKKKVSNMHT